MSERDQTPPWPDEATFEVRRALANLRGTHQRAQEARRQYEEAGITDSLHYPAVVAWCSATARAVSALEEVLSDGW